MAAEWAQFWATVIGLAVAVGVPWVLNLMERRDRKQDQAEARRREVHETRMLALWVNAVLHDLRVKADSIKKVYATIYIDTDAERYPAETAKGLEKLLTGFNLEFEPLSSRIIESLPKFDGVAVASIATAVRRARAFDLRNQQLGRLASNGQAKTDAISGGIRKQVEVLDLLIRACDHAVTALEEQFWPRTHDR